MPAVVKVEAPSINKNAITKHNTAANTALVPEGDKQLFETDHVLDVVNSLRQEAQEKQHKQDISPESRKILRDLDTLLADFALLATQLDSDSELQKTIYYGWKSTQSLARTTFSPLTRESKEKFSTLRGDVQKMGTKFSDLTTLVGDSVAFCKLLKDLAIILQDLVKTNIEQTSKLISEEGGLPQSLKDLSANIGKYAEGVDPENTPLTRGLDHLDRNGVQKTIGEAKTTVGDMSAEKIKQLKAQLPSEDVLIEQAVSTIQAAADTVNNQVDNAKTTAKQVEKKAEKTADKYDTKEDAAKGAIDNASAAGKKASKAAQKKAQEVKKEATKTAQKTADDFSKTTAGKDVQAVVDNVQEAATKITSGNASEATEAIQKARGDINTALNATARTSEIVKDNMLTVSEKHSQELTERIRAVLRLLRDKPAFQHSLRDLRDLFLSMRSTIATIPDTLNKQAALDNEQKFKEDAQSMAANMKSLLENLANQKSLDPLLEKSSALYEQVSKDAESSSIWQEFGSLVDECMCDTRRIEEPETEAKVRNFVERSRKSLTEANTLVKPVVDEVVDFTNSLYVPLAVEHLFTDLLSLTRDLVMDSRGQLQFKPSLLKDVLVLLLHVTEKFAFIPLPRIDADDGNARVVLDNMALRLSVIPPKVKITTETEFDRETGTSNRLKIEMLGISAAMKDIAYMFNKHSGIVRTGDVGLADVDLQKMDVTVHVEHSTEEGSRGLRVLSSAVEIGSLTLNIHDSHHDALYTILEPAIQLAARRQISSAMTEQLNNVLNQVVEYGNTTQLSIAL